MAKKPDTVVSGVAGKLEWLRDSVKAHPEGAADSTWAWIEELSKRAKSDATGADADLNELFRLGTAPTDLHGATEGMLVMTTTNDKFDAVVRVITSMWMPWQGKRFDKDNARREETTWHKIAAWGDLAEIVSDMNIKKGEQVMIEGKIRSRTWKPTDGQEQVITEVVADLVESLA